MEQKNYEELCFTDDFMFCKIMYENKDICKDIIELLLGCKIKDIIYPEKQKTIEITSDGKGIRLDVYLEDGNTVYDIEMQTTITKDLPKRSRYYQGMIDLNLIKRGGAYSELRESFVVFLCLKDMFNSNKSIYTFRNMCLENSDIELGDGTTKVFVNADGNREGLTKAQVAFLDFVSGKKPTDSLTEKLSNEVQKARDREEWRSEYMTLLQRDREKFEEGRVEGRSEELVSLVRDGLLDIHVAAERIDISVEEFEELMEKEKNK